MTQPDKKAKLVRRIVLRTHETRNGAVLVLVCGHNKSITSKQLRQRRNRGGNVAVCPTCSQLARELPKSAFRSGNNTILSTQPSYSQMLREQLEKRTGGPQ